MSQKGVRKGADQSSERCSFCGSERSEVELMFNGTGGAMICNRCIEHGYKILTDNNMTAAAAEPRPSSRSGKRIC